MAYQRGGSTRKPRLSADSVLVVHPAMGELCPRVPASAPAYWWERK